MNKIGIIINKVQSKKSVGLGTDELEETFINPLTNKPYHALHLSKIQMIFDARAIMENRLYIALITILRKVLERSYPKC